MSVKRISGRIVDVFNRTEYSGTVEIAGGVIREIRRDRVQKGKNLIMPGLVDAHIHIESSMLPPAEFARMAVVHGTVATVSDPHEIANVLGVAGVDYMISEGRKSPFKFNFGAPSCVPATSFETAGAELDPNAVDQLMAREEIKYLSEVMNFPAVLAGDSDMLAKIWSARRRGKRVDGHAPGLRGQKVRDYARAGISTDHECFKLAEAKDKLRAGMKILIREGSAARNFKALAPLLRTHADRCMLCCDDLHPDLLAVRHIDELVRRAIRSGANRFDAVAAASVNPVSHYGLDVGLLRKGDPADFIVVDNWRNFRVRGTYIDGQCVAKNGRTLLPRKRAAVPNRFHASKRSAEDFVVKAEGSRMRAIVALDGQLITRSESVTPRVREGFAVAHPAGDLLKIAVVNRYSKSTPPAVGFIRGFGLKRGAIASSVAHDSHNIVAVGANDEDLARAVNLVISSRGGISVVGSGRPAVLPLPIAGLMATGDGFSVARRYSELDALAKQLGSRLGAPFMTLAFMALLVIPDLKLSDRGLFSGSQWAFQPLFE